jgi:copper(I)-binding protein
MKNSIFHFAIVLGLLSSMPTIFAAESALMIQDPWVREAPPASKVLAAYLVVVNNSEQNRMLTDASSPSFERIEIHKTEVRDGVASMVRQDKVEVPGGNSVAFESGSYHLMLVGPREPLSAGDHIELSLFFANGEQLKVNADVRKAMEGLENMGNMKGMKSN